MNLHENQLAAVEAASQPGLTLISGGAGTGKTTVIKSIISRLGKGTLCAYAGKAAARVREVTGHPASTIHSFLGFRGTLFATGGLQGRTVIVDEASMVPSELMYEIVKRKPAPTAAGW